LGEILKATGPSSSDLVEVAFADDPAEGEMMRGLLEGDGIASFLQPTGLDGRSLGKGLLPPGPQRVLVHSSQAEAARSLLAGVLVEEEQEAEAEIANARHLEDAEGRGPRHYGLIGAYARIWLWSLAAFGAVFAVFMLLHS
jgi:hypothetical protein